MQGRVRSETTSFDNKMGTVRNTEVIADHTI